MRSRRCYCGALSPRTEIAPAAGHAGSGKTAAFLIPIVQKLMKHSSIVGARAVVLSPTRDLAQQTMKFAAKFATFTDLSVCLLVGGDNLDDQVRGGGGATAPRASLAGPCSTRRCPATRIS